MISTKILVHLYLQKNEGQSKVRNPSNRKTQILVIIIFYLPTTFVHYYFSFANEFCMFKLQSNITLFVVLHGLLLVHSSPLINIRLLPQLFGLGVFKWR